MTPIRALSAAAMFALASGCAANPVQVQAWQSGEAGFHTNSWWVDTGEEVVVFDAQFTPDLARELVAAIQAETDSPITTLVITHPNPDKFNGAGVFQELGATVVASEATAAAMPGVHAYKEAYFTGVGMFPEGMYPALPTVDRTFADTLTIDLAGSSTPLELSVLSHPGVTVTQTIAQVDNHVFVGDLVAADTHAWLEGGIVDGTATPDLVGWGAALDEALGVVGSEATLYPGRGPAGDAATVLAAQKQYLEVADAAVRDVLASRDDAVEALSGDGDAVYAEITSTLQTAFPDHAHPYLVTYGVYGLAWQIATSK